MPGIEPGSLPYKGSILKPLNYKGIIVNGILKKKAIAKTMQEASPASTRPG